MISEDKLNNLLGHTKTIIDHQRELKKARGETFNVFSILSMERSENKTHSAFLAELLNPKGSHLKGNAFLGLFLNVLKEESIDIATAQVKVEHYIGPRDDNAKTGGRIDIHIWDKSGGCISIENKIDAGDQNAQVERYCNYRKGNNNVYYLTLKGDEPSTASKGELQSGTDFHTISYRDQIQEWLDRCIKEAAEQPILRESIKQYKILIQKLTSTMDKTHQQNLTELMLKHFDEAEYIAANFTMVCTAIKEHIRQDVIKELEVRLSGRYSIIAGYGADDKYSNLMIKPKGFENSTIYYGVEGFSGLSHFGGALFVGVFNLDGEKSRAELFHDRFSDWWVKHQILKGPDHQEIKLQNPETLRILNSDKSMRDSFIHHVVNEIEAYLQQEEETVHNYLH